MKKMLPVFLFMLLSAVVVGCSDDKNEPKTHWQEGWEDFLHQPAVRAEVTYSCNACHASPINQRKDCVDGGCHTVNPRLIPISHGAVGGVVGDAYKLSHQNIPATQVNPARPYCIACHVTISKTATKNCGCHEFGVNASIEAPKMGIGEPIFE